jgi:hypothetical protein
VAALLKLLLNPTVILAIVTGVIIVGMHLRIDALKSSVNSCISEKATIQASWDKCIVADKSKEIALTDCTGNVAQIKESSEQMQLIISQNAVYKKKWKQVTAEQAELPPPKDDEPCLNGGKIDAGHKAVLAAHLTDVIEYYGGLRRKIKRTDSNGTGASAPQVLPPSPIPPGK